eukprot:scaffold4786_cov198-Amphora_coffeaeformis.AAC.7
MAAAISIQLYILLNAISQSKAMRRRYTLFSGEYSLTSTENSEYGTVNGAYWMRIDGMTFCLRGYREYLFSRLFLVDWGSRLLLLLVIGYNGQDSLGGFHDIDKRLKTSHNIIQSLGINGKYLEGDTGWALKVEVGIAKLIIGLDRKGYDIKVTIVLFNQIQGLINQTRIKQLSLQQ